MSQLVRGREDATRWLAAGLALARVGAPGAALVSEAAPWLAASAAELGELPPAGVIADLGRLLVSGEMASIGEHAPPVADPALLAALRAYDEQLLARLAADPRLEDAADALARLPVARRPAAVAYLVGALLERLACRGTAIPAAVARRAVGRPGEQLAEEGFAALRSDPVLVARLAADYDALVRAARQTRQLIGDRELFVLEHLDALGSAARRVAVTQIVEAAEELGRELPRRLRRSAARRGAAATQLDDESSYPTGGFAAVTTSGSLENLVTSELVYMEPDVDVDLFDMRYVEQELLYYTRDESSFVRRRHELSFVFDQSARAARVKDEGLRWQRLVLALGLVLCAVRRLVATLGHEALLIRVRFVDGDELSDERALAELLLAEWRERGLVEVDAVASLDEALGQAESRARRAVSDVIVVDSQEDSLPASRSSRVGHLSLARPIPTLTWSGDDRAKPESQPWPAWQRAMLDMLEGLV